MSGWGTVTLQSDHPRNETRFDVYETLCPKQMLVHKGDQIKNWSGECRDLIPTKLQCQTSRSKSAKGDYSKKIK